VSVQITVSRAPGKGFMANRRNTPTWLWPPPINTMSRSTGEVVVCIQSAPSSS
jgi:hypothetical protein